MTYRKLVFCKHCDGPMIHHYASKRNKCYRYYVCQNAQKYGYDKCVSPSLPAVELEEFVIDEIKAIGKDNDLIEENIKLVQAHLQDELDGLMEERKLVETEVLRSTLLILTALTLWRQRHEYDGDEEDTLFNIGTRQVADEGGA